MILGIDQLYLSPMRRNRTVPTVSVDLIRQLKEQGQVIPVVVRPGDDKRFEILTNAETWLGVQRIGLHTVDVFIRESISDSDARKIVNNSSDNSLTEAEWFESQLLSSGQGGEFKSIAALARYVRLDPSYVSHSLRLLTLEEPLKVALRAGALKVGHAKVLLAIVDQKRRFRLASKVIERKWSVRKLTCEAKNIEAMQKPVVPTTRKSADLIALENRLSEVLGSRVSIDEPGGTLNIDYGKNLDVLDGILSRIDFH